MNDTLKILVFSHSSDLAGAEKSLLDLFDDWSKNQPVEFRFVIRKPLLGLAREMDKRGWRYDALHYTNWAQRNPPTNPVDVSYNMHENKYTVATIEKIISDYQPDLVITNTMVAPWAALAAHNSHVPHLWFIREYGDTDSGFVFAMGKRRTFEIINALSDMVVTNSETLAKHVSRLIDAKKLSVLYTPFDLDGLRSMATKTVPRSFFLPNSLKVVITGRIAPSKGQACVAEAIGILARQGVDAELCIIGQASQKGDANELEEVIQRYGIDDRVHLLGHQPNPLAYVAQADVAITASYNEAFGRTTFEYMALGKPVVGADSGATPEMITSGKNGYLYKLNDAHDLADKLQNYANEPGLIEKHGKAGEQKVIEMQGGKNNSTVLFKRIQKMLKDGTTSKEPFSFPWSDTKKLYASYLHQHGVIGVPRLVGAKLRQVLKAVYLKSQ